MAEALTTFMESEVLQTFVTAALVALLGLLVILIVRRRVRLRFLGTYDELFRRLVTYVLFVIVVLWVLRLVGVDVTVLLGAAGVLTVAIGFASQTAASNFISGFFLMAERPFMVGDYIRIGETFGEVISIDLMAVRLRTTDNSMVRIPSETVIKANVRNTTHFPIRRIDLKVGVAYKEDLTRVRSVLLSVADAHPLCLEEPQPVFMALGYGESEVSLQFSVWVERDNYLELRTDMYMHIKAAFDQQGIEIPFPHRSLYAGSATTPLPVRMSE